MEIYPPTQAEMFLAVFALGLGAGLFRQLLLALRTVLGAYLPPERMRALYERPLPLLRRPVGFPRHRARRGWCFAVAFGGDLFFCLSCTCALLLLLYDYNEGAWRISVPVLFLLGLAFFRVGTARLFARMNELFAYGLSVLLFYARAGAFFPVRKVASLAMRFLLCPIKKGVQALCQRRRKQVSERLCRAQLALASRGLIVQERKTYYVKKEDHATAMDHPNSDRAAVLHGSGRRLWPLARMERAGKTKRRA